MKRELKRQIKQDELRTGLERASLWTREHAREVQVTVVTLLVLFAAALIVQSFRDRQEAAAEASFSKAFETYHAPVTTELPPDATRPSGAYATREEKFRKALSEFEALEQSAPRHLRPRARYYVALSRLELGDVAAAEKALSELAGRKDKDDLVPSLARLALADIHRGNGQPQKAIDAYRQMLEDSSFLLPRDHVLLKLGAVLEEANRLKDARASYERLVQEYPESVYAGEARQRAEYLQSAHG
jgi:tetratricopeptide (TPR) repeat protein